jgi:hypothetical protein
MYLRAHTASMIPGTATHGRGQPHGPRVAHASALPAPEGAGSGHADRPTPRPAPLEGGGACDRATEWSTERRPGEPCYRIREESWVSYGRCHKLAPWARGSARGACSELLLTPKRESPSASRAGQLGEMYAPLHVVPPQLEASFFFVRLTLSRLSTCRRVCELSMIFE